MAYADAVRDEILDLLGAGADVVEVDEPYMHARPEAARDCGLGVLDLSTDEVETAETVTARIRPALPHAGPDRLIAAPTAARSTCPATPAYGKLEALVAGARLAAEGSPPRPVERSLGPGA